MPTLWIDKLQTFGVPAAGGQVIDQLTAEMPITTLRTARLTLLRTIVRLDLAASVRDSGEGDQAVRMGICIVPVEAVANPPDPKIATDHPTRGWIWRSAYRVYAVATDDQNVDVIRIDVDLRSKRKLENGLCVFVVDNDDNQGTATAIQVIGVIRQLWMVS